LPRAFLRAMLRLCGSIGPILVGGGLLNGL
jgi:hypothetical protein